MSEPVGVGAPQEQPGAGRPGKGRAGRWVRGRSARWVVAGAAVVVIGGGAAAVAVHHEEEGRHGGDRVSAAGEHERFDGRAAHKGGDGGRDGGRDGQRAAGPGGRRADGPDAKAAPAPLPSLAAADAVAKAAAAVPDGRVESLAAVAEQGGGRAWRAVVVGPDGVRHLVTVDGVGGTVTGNTVIGG
ncbi:hypothetical protein [Kitasatospora indigofera]|uniref:hypothetical protein n=1 Tax=Kitasatospora indigofera TaxID=67307 RepID=UPI00167E39B4|nr:hypothetical protein [Kitasatospora indigofera]